MSANAQDDDFQYLASSTVGMIFLGTPHRGTQAAKWGEIVATTARALRCGSETSILKDLREDSENSRDLLYDFTLWANRASVKIICFFEQHETDYGERFLGTWKELVRYPWFYCLLCNFANDKISEKVVNEHSACIDGYRKVPLPTDHLKINKYSGPDDPSYNAVYPLLVEMAQNADRIVQSRLNRKQV